MSDPVSPTPWRVDGIELYDANNRFAGYLDARDVDRDLIVSAVNFYSAIPEEVRRLKPETVAKCLEGIICGGDVRQMAIALQAEKEGE